VAGVCISADRATEIVIADASGQQSSIELSGRFTIGRGKNTQTVLGFSQPSQFDPRTMSPLLDLIGVVVMGATAFSDGRLELSFSNSVPIQTCSTTGYEAWHFQFPRAGRAPGGDGSNHISIYGADGHVS
jgi:hypothetical protein